MRRSLITWRSLGKLELPSDLAQQVKLLLRDPATGRTRYGELRRLNVQLWSNWVDAQSAVARPEHPYLKQGPKELLEL